MSREENIEIRGHKLTHFTPGIWRLEPTGKMRVAVHLVASKELLLQVKDDKSIEQIINVSTLPGILDPVLTMPDIHQGYGFPIGGVAAFRLDTGVISPGGVGYDINCGVRILKTSLEAGTLKQKSLLRSIVGKLFETIPSGVGSKRSDLSLSASDLEEVLHSGVLWALSKEFAEEGDQHLIEEVGHLKGALPDKVSERAKQRGKNQLGTLGSGNHFVEIQYVDHIFDSIAGDALGLFKDQVVVMIHTGSRGLGYQVCTDYLELALSSGRKHGIDLVDRELASAPIFSEEGQSYLGAMKAAANFAFVNRQVISHWVRAVFAQHFPQTRGKMPLLYDICHNIAKVEEIRIGDQSLQACVHRKGATRAYPPNHPQVPLCYHSVGQPIIVPGDMGRYSFIMVGQKGSLERSFGSACHGAGRELSRTAARKRGQGRALKRELEDQGIIVQASGRDTLIEEMPEAYKDVSSVVQATSIAQIAKTVARLKPIGVIKG